MYWVMIDKGAQVVADLIADLCAKEWRSAYGDLAVIGLEGILVFTPFNAQVREIEAAMEARGIKDARVGTVDKFQGVAGASRYLFDGVVYGRGRTEWHGVSLRSAAAQRGNIARTLSGDPGFQRRAGLRILPHSATDSARERVVPVPRSRARNPFALTKPY
jgi:hypothetical protein